jgi:catechol 2,3-dioxygenase-like lactoylglutathione lyase family enzyme
MTLGLNHVTFAVSDVSRAVAFYEHVIGCRKVAVWDEGAYLRAGEAWLCLSLDMAAAPEVRGDYTHTAFTFDAAGLAGFRGRLRAAGGVEWKRNSSEGDSVYFLDPDGHRLEAHVGDLQSRLACLRAAPYSGLVLHDHGR